MMALRYVLLYTPMSMHGLEKGLGDTALGLDEGLMGLLSLLETN